MAECCVICKKKQSDGETVDHPWRNFKLNQHANWPATQHLEIQLYSKPEMRIFCAGYACFYLSKSRNGITHKLYIYICIVIYRALSLK
jgi:hypothetical protein